MCKAFSLSKNETMSHWPAYVEIVQATASYPVWLFNIMGVRNYTSYNHLISRQKHTHQLLLENLFIMLALCSMETPLIMPETMPT